jgi:hypothetical protein
MKLVGLTGEARAGKDTVGQMIRVWGDRQGFSVERESFARKLKVSAMRALGFIGSDAALLGLCERLKHDASINVEFAPSAGGTVPPGEHRISGRQFLQLYGTEAHREVFGKDFWVRALLDDFLPHGPDDPRWSNVLVITDVRFENEADAIRAYGGEVWEVVRDHNPDRLDGALQTHASESGLPSELVDHIIDNSGSLEDLERQVGIACLERL